MSNQHEEFSNQAIIVNEFNRNNVQLKGDITMDIENDLNTIDFENAPAAKAPTFKHGIPSGSYKARIMKASRRVHQEGGYDVVRVSLALSVQPYMGVPLEKYYNLKSKAAVDFFRREMNELGIALTTRAELDSLCNSLVGKNVLAQLADHPSGNQVILLKHLKVTANADELWS
jgi:hypothetical protein